MAKICLSCGKGSRMGGHRNLLRAHYNPTKKTRKYPNLQWARFLDGKRRLLCTNCIKRGAYLLMPREQTKNLQKVARTQSTRVTRKFTPSTMRKK